MNRYKAIKVNGKKVDEHPYIMEQHLGRKLDRLECVHHINGDKRDNRLENLELMPLSEHSRLHRVNGDTGGRLPRTHGQSGFRRGCRCEECVMAVYIKNKKYRQLKKLENNSQRYNKIKTHEIL